MHVVVNISVFMYGFLLYMLIMLWFYGMTLFHKMHFSAFTKTIRYFKHKIMTKSSSENEVEAAAGSSMDENDVVEYLGQGQLLYLI